MRPTRLSSNPPPESVGPAARSSRSLPRSGRPEPAAARRSLRPNARKPESVSGAEPTCTLDAPEAVAQPRTAAGVLFFDEADRVLLVKPTYKPGWEIPGGYLHPGETPSEGAAREVKEELGITPPIGHLLIADWAPHPTEGDKLLFVFDGGVLPADELERITVDQVEIGEYAFHPSDQLDELLIPRLARRVHAAWAAWTHSETVYLEHGGDSPVSQDMGSEDPVRQHLDRFPSKGARRFGPTRQPEREPEPIPERVPTPAEVVRLDRGSHPAGKHQPRVLPPVAGRYTFLGLPLPVLRRAARTNGGSGSVQSEDAVLFGPSRRVPSTR
ncbi:NUDIX hydrolase [Kitasatospora sp. NPDC088351]|uniref:NUDIX hydrolase n=1 Tax=Kitasatospora sp. NPDC088351 TaxID=3155180 RepID=UPI003447405A